jgi:hypothetical protein
MTLRARSKRPDWFTPQEVGNMVGGFSAQFIRDEIRAGELEATSVRSRAGKMVYYRIRRADAEAYMHRLSNRSTQTTQATTNIPTQ